MFSACSCETVYSGCWPLPKVLGYHFNGYRKLANSQLFRLPPHSQCQVCARYIFRYTQVTQTRFDTSTGAVFIRLPYSIIFTIRQVNEHRIGFVKRGHCWKAG